MSIRLEIHSRSKSPAIPFGALLHLVVSVDQQEEEQQAARIDLRV